MKLHRLSPKQSAGLRYCAELTVGVLLVSLAMRTWLLQGVVVPVCVSGGSMAPTLCGEAFEASCRRCGFTFSFGREQSPPAGRLQCPNCGFRHAGLEGARRQAADRVWIDRASYQLRSPDRWEVVVFRCPDRPRALCVKRVVGLPGEQVEIRRGDVYIGGRITRKSYRQVQAASILVHEAAFPSTGDSLEARWKSAEARSRWQRAGDGFRFDGLASAADAEDDAPSEKRLDRLVYHHPGGRPIRDDFAYNQAASRILNDVSDLRVTFEFRARGSGELRILLLDGRERFVAILRIGKGRDAACRLLRNGDEVAQCEAGLRREWTSASQVELSQFDRRVMLAVDGSILLDYAYDPSERPWKPSSRPTALSAAGVEAEVRNLRLWRDIYYVARPERAWGVGAPCRVGADSLFVLGDNSPISRDSRTFPEGVVSTKLLIGKAFGVD